MCLGVRKRHLSSGCTSLLYHGRTRLDSREYEQLMPYRFFCTQCSFMSKREGHLRKHTQLHARGVSVLKCPSCPYRTTRSNHLTRHQRLQHSLDDTRLACTVTGCTYTASSDRLLRRHLNTRHSSTSSTVPASSSSSCSSLLACPVSGCSYRALTASRLQRHKARHRVLDNRYQRHQQQQQSYSGVNVDEQLVERYRCRECSYETSQREHFRRHVDCVHRNVRQWLCDVCGRRFKRHDSLIQHSLIRHSADQSRHSTDHRTDQSQPAAAEHYGRHQCSVCQRTFRNKVSTTFTHFLFILLLFTVLGSVH